MGAAARLSRRSRLSEAGSAATNDEVNSGRPLRTGVFLRRWRSSVSDVLPTIAVGGVRSGVDAAKAIALGAVAAGVGRPLLVCATEGEDASLVVGRLRTPVT